MKEILNLTRDNRLLALSQLLWGIGDGLFFYIQPLYLKQLGADPVVIGSILAVGAAAAAISLIPAGYIADHFGRKPVLVVGFCLGVLGALFMYMASGLLLYTIGLMLYMGTGFILAPMNSYASEARGEQSIQRALTLVAAGFMAGSILSPAIGGFIGRSFGLRTVYGIGLVAFFLSMLAIMLIKPQPIVPPPAGHTRYGPLLRNRDFLGFLLLMFFVLTSLYLGVPLASNFLADVYHYDAGMVGLLGSLNAIGGLTLNILFGHNNPRKGLLLAHALMIIWLCLLLATGGIGWLVLAFFLRAGSNYFARNMGDAYVGRVVAPSELGLAFGMFETMSAFVMTIGPLAAGFLYKHSPSLPFQTGLVFSVVSFAVIFLLMPRRDSQKKVGSENTGNL